jgi:hypothetical protein
MSRNNHRESQRSTVNQNIYSVSQGNHCDRKWSSWEPMKHCESE